MGSNGPDDLFQFIAGCNTFNTAKQSRTPVIMVPVDYIFTTPKRIAYAFNYLQNAMLPLAPVTSLLGPITSEIIVLQIVESAHSLDVDEELAQIQETIKHYLNGAHQLVFRTIHADNPALAINEFVEKNDIDLLAVCHLNKGFLQRLFHTSVLKRLTAISNRPILIFSEN
jgi:nucleotide-binding universal stress UspA family protein